MILKTEILAIAILACSAVAAPSCACTRNLNPVCGSNGQTYSNECLLECDQQEPGSSLVKVSDGACPPQNCICTMEYKPVCGSDGRTYGNACGARCNNVEVSHSGACLSVQVAQPSPLPPPCVCDKTKKPVCGSDGQTYSNDCMLNCATATNSRLSIDHYGPCQGAGTKVHFVDNAGNDDQPALEPLHWPVPDICTCTRNLEPVCGADGVTYGNECLLRCARAQKAKEGPCNDEYLRVVV